MSSCCLLSCRSRDPPPNTHAHTPSNPQKWIYLPNSAYFRGEPPSRTLFLRIGRYPDPPPSAAPPAVDARALQLRAAPLPYADSWCGIQMQDSVFADLPQSGDHTGTGGPGGAGGAGYGSLPWCHGLSSDADYYGPATVRPPFIYSTIPGFAGCAQIQSLGTSSSVQISRDFIGVTWLVFPSFTMWGVFFFGLR